MKGLSISDQGIWRLERAFLWRELCYESRHLHKVVVREWVRSLLFKPVEKGFKVSLGTWEIQQTGFWLRQNKSQNKACGWSYLLSGQKCLFFIALVDFWIVNQSSINPTWLRCVIIFVHCWIHFVWKHFVRILASIFVKDSVLFLYCLWFWH